MTSSSAHGSKSTFHLCDKKQKGKASSSSSSKNGGASDASSTHLHPLGVKTLPRHFRVRGSIDSGAFCFDYESCQTDSSQHTQHSSTLNNSGHSNNNHIHGGKREQISFDDQFSGISYLEATPPAGALGSSSALIVANHHPNLHQPILIQRSSPMSIPSSSHSSQVVEHAVVVAAATLNHRVAKRSQQHQQTDAHDIADNAIVVLPFGGSSSPASSNATTSTGLANSNNVHFHEVKYASSSSSSSNHPAHHHPPTSSTSAFRVDHRDNAILPLKRNNTKDIAVGGGGSSHFNNDYEYLNSQPKFATMHEVGVKKQKMKEKGFSTMNPKSGAAKQVWYIIITLATGL